MHRITRWFGLLLIPVRDLNTNLEYSTTTTFRVYDRVNGGASKARAPCGTKFPYLGGDLVLQLSNPTSAQWALFIFIQPAPSSIKRHASLLLTAKMGISTSTSDSKSSHGAFPPQTCAITQRSRQTARTACELFDKAPHSG
jgi:hypothetical protein